jgi:hypothetical protein
MTTHHDDDDAWLDALAGKNNVSKNPETELLREKLLKRNRQHMESVGTSSNEMEAIRGRLDQEGLLGKGLKQTWWQGFTEWLAQHQSSAWVGAVASVMLVIGVLSTHSFKPNEILKGSYDALRGRGGESNTNKTPGLFEGIDIIGRQTQVVKDLQVARLAWESDLISSGLDYKISEQKNGNGLVDIYIKLSDNVDLLDEDHRRVLVKGPRSGVFILTLDLANNKSQ